MADLHPPSSHTNRTYDSVYGGSGYTAKPDYRVQYQEQLESIPQLLRQRPDSYGRYGVSPWTLDIERGCIDASFAEPQPHQVARPRRGLLPLKPDDTAKFMMHPAIQYLLRSLALSQLEVAYPAMQYGLYPLDDRCHL